MFDREPLSASGHHGNLLRRGSDLLLPRHLRRPVHRLRQADNHRMLAGLRRRRRMLQRRLLQLPDRQQQLRPVRERLRESDDLHQRHLRVSESSVAMPPIAAMRRSPERSEQLRRLRQRVRERHLHQRRVHMPPGLDAVRRQLLPARHVLRARRQPGDKPMLLDSHPMLHWPARSRPLCSAGPAMSLLRCKRIVNACLRLQRLPARLSACSTPRSTRFSKQRPLSTDPAGVADPAATATGSVSTASGHRTTTAGVTALRAKCDHGSGDASAAARLEAALPSWRRRASCPSPAVADAAPSACMGSDGIGGAARQPWYRRLARPDWLALISRPLVATRVSDPGDHRVGRRRTALVRVCRRSPRNNHAMTDRRQRPKAADLGPNGHSRLPR